MLASILTINWLENEEMLKPIIQINKLVLEAQCAESMSLFKNMGKKSWNLVQIYQHYSQEHLEKCFSTFILGKEAAS